LIPFTALLLQTVPSTKGKGEEGPLLEDAGHERAGIINWDINSFWQ